MLSIVEQQLAKEAELKTMEDEAIRVIEETLVETAKLKASKPSNRTEYQLEKRRLQAKRARARKKLFILQYNQFIKTQEHKPERNYKSVIIKKPIEAIDRFKRIEAKT